MTVRGTRLRTERLVLRPFKRDDVDDALAYRNDEGFARFLPHIPQPFTRADAERFVATNREEPWETNPTFGVELDGRLIGTVNLEIDVEQRTAMLGYAIARDTWGLGIAAEAAAAVITWGFETLRLERIWASTDARHTRSRRVMEKLGMHYEKLPAHHLDRAGGRVDEVVYGLSRARWQPPNRHV